MRPFTSQPAAISPRAVPTANLPLPAILPTRTATHLSCPQDFREPLYLTDKPVVYKDTRTEEERRYPQLFRWACVIDERRG